jgi:hypothetical protein
MENLVRSIANQISLMEIAEAREALGVGQIFQRVVALRGLDARMDGQRDARPHNRPSRLHAAEIKVCLERLVEIPVVRFGDRRRYIDLRVALLCAGE